MKEFLDEPVTTRRLCLAMLAPMLGWSIGSGDLIAAVVLAALSLYVLLVGRQRVER